MGFSWYTLQLVNTRVTEYIRIRKVEIYTHNKLAIITTEDFAYGIAHQFVAYREEEKIGAAVFRTKEEAIEWLNQ